jgi:glycosyltransferase involved in cell wall biosynthesis
MREDTVAAYTGVGAAVRAHLRERLARVAFESADVVVSVNPDWKINLPAQPRRFEFIPNIVDEDFFAREHRPESGLVLFVGANKAIKGWDLLEEAWPRVLEAVPDARLHVIGWHGGAQPEPESSISVEPWMSSSELADRMVRASVLVIASEFEVSPTVLAEAWAVGVPVVATAVGGIPALATDAAVLVERTPDALASGVIAALSGGERIERLVAEATRRVERHRAAAVATAHKKLYEELR